jgi:hypothetical protein
MIPSTKLAKDAALHRRLLSSLKYVRSTGEFIALTNTTRRYARGVVGTLRADGSYIVSFEGKLYTAGRLAYFWMNGFWPAVPVCVKTKTRTFKDYAWNNLTHPTPES